MFEIFYSMSHRLVERSTRVKYTQVRRFELRRNYAFEKFSNTDYFWNAKGENSRKYHSACQICTTISWTTS
jgi:hypothetical protein